jgi:hypothetical protein
MNEYTLLVCIPICQIVWPLTRLQTFTMSLVKMSRKEPIIHHLCCVIMHVSSLAPMFSVLIMCF